MSQRQNNRIPAREVRELQRAANRRAARAANAQVIDLTHEPADDDVIFLRERRVIRTPSRDAAEVAAVNAAHQAAMNRRRELDARRAAAAARHAATAARVENDATRMEAEAARLLRAAPGHDAAGLRAVADGLRGGAAGLRASAAGLRAGAPGAAATGARAEADAARIRDHMTTLGVRRRFIHAFIARERGTLTAQRAAIPYPAPAAAAAAPGAAAHVFMWRRADRQIELLRLTRQALNREAHAIVFALIGRGGRADAINDGYLVTMERIGRNTYVTRVHDTDMSGRLLPPYPHGGRSDGTGRIIHAHEMDDTNPANPPVRFLGRFSQQSRGINREAGVQFFLDEMADGDTPTEGHYFQTDGTMALWRRNGYLN